MSQALNPMELTRSQLVDALRAVTPIRKYQELTKRSTATLRASLAYYQSPTGEREAENVRAALLVIGTIE